ncbi:MAG: hypothetical protein QG583_321 [Patescibacteria group bacterium]|nr:hypothetical protein [Patescibacteria group bacterium]
MSIRNFKLLIILIVIILLAVLVSLSSKKSPSEEGKVEEGTNFFKDFLPFGKKNTNINEEGTVSDVSNNGNTESVSKKLILTKISEAPVSGFGVFMKERFVEIPVVVPVFNPNPETTPIVEEVFTAPPTEVVPIIKYADKSTGTISQTFLDEINRRKLSKEILPNAHDSFWGDNGASVIMRYLKSDGETISSFAGSIPNDTLGGDTSTNEVTGSFLPENIIDISVSPDTSKIFYLSKTKDSVVGTVSTPLGAQKIQVFKSPFTEWLSSWPNQNMITLTTKASGLAPGYMYAIDPEKKNWARIIGGINGLTTLTSPNGKFVLYSNSDLSLNILNIETRESVGLKIKTLPEKCVWNKQSDGLYCFVPDFLDKFTYPDAWYQGEITFFDQIWKVNINNLAETLILDPRTSKGTEIVDGIKPTLDESENYLFFMNKRDSYLWKLDLK